MKARYGLVFPGQGSQMIGMGEELARNYPVAKRTFQELDDVLKQNLSQLMFSGDLNELTLTANCQPALMAVSIAVWRVLMEEIPIEKQIVYGAGHSLGEYAALVAADVLPYAAAVRLLRTRGEAMQKAVPQGVGGMVALIGANLEIAQKIAEACGQQGVCEVANDNTVGQVILSGEKTAVDAAQNFAEAYGLRKVMPLNVSAPFHSSLMQPAAEAMARALADMTFASPQFPIIPNVTAEPETDPEKLKTLLVEQVTARVRWRETILCLQAQEVAPILELGSGKVLAGLIKRTAPDSQVVSLHTPQDIEDFLRNASQY